MRHAFHLRALGVAHVLLATFASSAAVANEPAGGGVMPAAAAAQPFSGAPFKVPGRFEAEDFDRGGQDVGYHDNAPGNTGGAYRLDEDVDIRATGDEDCAYVIFNFEAGEWLSYTLDVTREGQYNVDLRLSTTLNDAAFSVEIDGVDVSGRVVVPNTGSWQTYRWFGAHRIPLAAGRHVLRVVSAQQYFNFDAILVMPSEQQSTRSPPEFPSAARDAQAADTTAARVRARARGGR
jgi:hypothetical protein